MRLLISIILVIGSFVPSLVAAASSSPSSVAFTAGQNLKDLLAGRDMLGADKAVKVYHSYTKLCNLVQKKTFVTLYDIFTFQTARAAVDQNFKNGVEGQTEESNKIMVLAASAILDSNVKSRVIAYRKWMEAKHATTMGFVNGIVNGNTIVGWACKKKIANSIAVDVYVGHPGNAGGEYLGRYPANLLSEQGVVDACQSNGTHYRYNIALSKDKLAQAAGKNIWIYGVMPNGRTIPDKTNELTLSGWYAFPDSKEPEVWYAPSIPWPTYTHSAIATNGQVALTWPEVSDVVSYTVQYGRSTPVDVGKTTSFTVTGLTNGALYDFSVIPLKSPGNPKLDEAEYMTLFSNPASWSYAKSRIKVFSRDMYYFWAADPKNVQVMMEWLRANNIKLALAMGSALSTNTCGRGEGYNSIAQMRADIRQLKRLGVVPDMVHLDEPLWYGHYSSDPSRNPCHWSIDQVIAQTVDVFKAYQAAFPNIDELHSIEPIDSMAEVSATWVSDLRQWIQGLKEAGVPLKSVQNDINWTVPVSRNTPALVKLLEEEDIVYGLFFVGGGTWNVRSVASWMASAKAHIQMYNVSGNKQPGIVIFSNWSSYKVHNTPDSSPLSLTYLTNYYFSDYAKKRPPTPLYRMYSSIIGRHFYTTDQNERDFLIANQGWHSEGYEGNIYPDNQGAPGLVPFYRFYSPAWKDHFYSLFKDNPPPLFNYEGIQGYVFPGANALGFDVKAFSRIASNGDNILRELKRVGIVEEFVPGKLRLKKKIDLLKGDIRAIAGRDFDQTWNILQEGCNGGIPLYQGHSTWNKMYFFYSLNNYDGFPKEGLTKDGIAAYVMP